MFYIILLISISTILSYLILKFIYEILFKSQKKVSKFLIFLGSIGLIIFYYTPYSWINYILLHTLFFLLGAQLLAV